MLECQNNKVLGQTETKRDRCSVRDNGASLDVRFLHGSVRTIKKESEFMIFLAICTRKRTREEMLKEVIGDSDFK